jgi:hypothetical protein
MKILIHKLNVRKTNIFFRKEIKFYFEYLVENDIILYISHLETKDDFWKVIRTFENVILSDNDLFIRKDLLTIECRSRSNYKKIKLTKSVTLKSIL